MFLTKEQRKAVFMLYQRSADGSASYLAFRRRVRLGFMGDYVSIAWCGMFVGIEKDGYTHT